MYPLTAGVVIESKELWDEVHGALGTLPIRLQFELPEIPADWAGFRDRIERMRPDVILLDVSKLSEPLEEIVKRIRSTSPQPAVFALHPTAEPDNILRALRAGVSEYLYPPIQGSLQAALERLSIERQQMREKLVRGGRVIAFVSAKGGCGATTIACHVAAELPRHAKGKVLLADLDLQSGMVGFMLKTQSPYSVADAVNNLQRLDHSYWQGLVSNGIPNLEIITAPSTPSGKQVSAAHLKQVIAFVRNEYDWVVLDLGRNLSPGTLSLLEVINETYLVVTHEVPALHQAKQMIQVLLDAGYGSSQLRLILNRSARRFDVTLEELERMLGLPIYATVENDFNALHEAFSEGHLLDESSDVGRDLGRLAAKIAGVSEAPQKKKKFLLFG